MIQSGTRTILVLFLLISIICGFLQAVTVFDHYPDDDYIIEHQVTYDEAIVEARRLRIYPGPIPGCKKCTSAEMTYCTDNSVLNDHCCCEGSYNEVFPFVEHTCKVNRQPCTVLAGDCAEYTRLRECCCDSYLASLWKYEAGGASIRVSNAAPIIGVLILLLVIQRLLY